MANRIPLFEDFYDKLKNKKGEYIGMVSTPPIYNDSDAPPEANPQASDAPGAGAASESQVNEKDYTQEQRDIMAKNGEALPDGSFPIKDKEDIENAIKLAHMAKDEAEAKSHIKKRAGELNATDLIPKEW